MLETRKGTRACIGFMALTALLSCASPPQSRVPAASDPAAPRGAAAGVLAPPSLLFGDLYADVALSGMFEDSKQWADAVPKRPPHEILARYESADPDSFEALQAFVHEKFIVDPPAPEAQPPTEGLPLRRHIAELWPLLTRTTPDPPPFSSKLPLPNPYVVPGGRFREIYYWDSWFTMLGFGPEQADLRKGMVDNFAWLVRRYGRIPNGSRTYYLSRSQPPFFFKMVELLAPAEPADAWARYLEELKREHAFWMRGSENAAPGGPVRRVVVMPDGSLLNRYWDDRAAPRDESYREDVETARRTQAREPERLYRDIRAAAESGWDFSSRWFADGQNLATIRTTEIVPPDLNSLLYGLERAIARGCEATGDRACADAYAARAAARRAAIRKYLWNGETGVFDDWHWPERHLLGHMTAAALYPLFTGVATDMQAARVADAVEAHLLKQGGLVTSNVTTGQQWDAPNGWAPLQWIAVTGLRRYDEPALAQAIAYRWLTTVSSVYAETGKLLEKYNVVEQKPGGGGEYPLQDGFGWTNGVTIAMLRLYPAFELPAEARQPAVARDPHPDGRGATDL